MFLYLKFILLVSIFIDEPFESDAARILAIVPDPGRSHFVFHNGIMKSLADAGHHVTFITPYRDPNPHINITYVNSTLHSKPSEDLMESDFKSMSNWEFFETDAQINIPLCYNIIQLEEIQTILKSDVKLYDIMLTETIIMFECYLPLARKLGIPVIGTCAMRYWVTTDEMFDNWSRFVIPSAGSPFSRNMGLIQKLQNTWESVYLRFLYRHLQRTRAEEFQREFFPDFYSQPNYEISLLFRNSHPSLFSIPAAPTLVDVAGIHLSPPKPLPQDLEKFVSDAKDGVILLTFGSITKSHVVGPELRKIFRDTFAELPQRVIWKFEDPIENLTENILLSKWVPQRDILVHKNVKAFITHAGASGMYEAIDAGVPVIIIPVYMDQLPNAALLQDRGVGIHLDIKTITKEIFSKALNEILHNEKYSVEMKKLSRQFWDRPMSPQQSVVYWTEYVIRHNGTQHLKTLTADMPLYQYLLLDVFLIILVVLLLVIYILKLICKVCGRTICRKTVAVRKKKKE